MYRAVFNGAQWESYVSEGLGKLSRHGWEIYRAIDSSYRKGGGGGGREREREREMRERERERVLFFYFF